MVGALSNHTRQTTRPADKLGPQHRPCEAIPDVHAGFGAGLPAFEDGALDRKTKELIVPSRSASRRRRDGSSPRTGRSSSKQYNTHNTIQYTIQGH